MLGDDAVTIFKVCVDIMFETRVVTISIKKSNGFKYVVQFFEIAVVTISAKRAPGLTPF